AFHFALADDVVCPVRALDENIGMDRQDGLKRRVVLKPGNEIHDLEPIQKFRAFMLRNNRPVGTLYPCYRTVAVDGNDQGVAQSPGAPQKIDMSGMQNIEASVSEHHR